MRTSWNYVTPQIDSCSTSVYIGYIKTKRKRTKKKNEETTERGTRKRKKKHVSFNTIFLRWRGCISSRTIFASWSIYVVIILNGQKERETNRSAAESISMFDEGRRRRARCAQEKKKRELGGKRKTKKYNKISLQTKGKKRPIEEREIRARC